MDDQAGISDEAQVSPAAIGFRVKSGWAVAVLVSGPAKSPAVLDRRRVELSDPTVPQSWQPYHAGIGHEPASADVIEGLARIVEHCAGRSFAELLQSYGPAVRRLRGAGIVVGSTRNPASIANPHIRAHAAEGQLFRTMLEEATRRNGLPATTVQARDLYAALAQSLKLPPADVRRAVTELGRAVGTPWGADEKAAAAAAWLALRAAENRIGSASGDSMSNVVVAGSEGE